MSGAALDEPLVSGRLLQRASRLRFGPMDRPRPSVHMRRTHRRSKTMSITNRIVLAAGIALASSSAALAQGFDPNLSNRIPVLNEPGVYGYPPGGGSGTRLLGSFESAPVALYGRSYGPRVGAGAAY